MNKKVGIETLQRDRCLAGGCEPPVQGKGWSYGLEQPRVPWVALWWLPIGSP